MIVRAYAISTIFMSNFFSPNSCRFKQSIDVDPMGTPWPSQAIPPQKGACWSLPALEEFEAGDFGQLLCRCLFLGCFFWGGERRVIRGSDFCKRSC